MRGTVFIAILGMLFCFTSCKTEFEKIRSSNEPQKILKAADRYYEKEEYVRAQTLYELVIPFYRGKEEAEDIFYNYSYSHYNMGQFILASHYFKNFSNTFYNSDRKEEAAFMSAYSQYRLSPSYRLDQSYSTKAIEAFQTFINTYPSSNRVQECNDLIDEMRKKLEQKAFYSSHLYYDMKEYISAVTSFENMLAEFPETKRYEEILYLITKSSFQLAEKSVYDKQEKRYNEAIKNQEKFKKKFPKSKYNKELLDITKACKEALKKFKV